MKWLFLFFCCTFLYANQAIQLNSYFNYHSTNEINLNSREVKTFDLTLVLDKDSNWSRLSLDTELEKTQRSLKLCGIGIDKVELIYVSLPEKTKTQLLVKNPYLGPPELVLVEEGIPQRKIIGFLNQKVKPYGSAFAINLKSVLNSERYSNLPSLRPLMHTFWISDDKITHAHTPGADKTYSTLAHEIVHIIGNLGHLEDNQIPNLMGGSDRVGKNYFLNSSQCEAISKYFF